MFSARLYWCCQFAGWGIWTALNLALYREWAMLWLGLSGLLTSHAIRWVLRRRGWHEQLSARVVLGAILLTVPAACAVAGLNTLIVVLLFRKSTPENPIAGVLYAIGIWLFLLSAWQAVYFAAHWFQRTKRAEVEAARLDLLLLRSQLNPHFLFNCLNSIRALIAENPARAQDAVTHLSTILRYTLQAADRPSVPFAEELDIVREYLALEKIRFEDRLQFEMRIDPGALDAHLPPMLLQVLVENAIKHGIGRHIAGGAIAIEARRSATALALRVTNPGAIDADPHSEGIGLRYARRAQFALTEAGGIVTAEVVVPQ